MPTETEHEKTFMQDLNCMYSLSTSLFEVEHTERWTDCSLDFFFFNFVFFVSSVCVRLKQQNQDGRHLKGQTKSYRKQHCQAQLDFGLCSDDDWVKNTYTHTHTHTHRAVLHFPHEHETISLTHDSIYL